MILPAGNSGPMGREAASLTLTHFAAGRQGYFTEETGRLTAEIPVQDARRLPPTPGADRRLGPCGMGSRVLGVSLAPEAGALPAPPGLAFLPAPRQ